MKNVYFVNKIFDIIERGDMKLRIMFTQNRNRPVLEDYQIDRDYFMLYCQFIKHAFGLQFSVPDGGTAAAAILLDDVPHNAEKFNQFKDYLSSLSAFPKWSSVGFSIASDRGGRVSLSSGWQQISGSSAGFFFDLPIWVVAQGGRSPTGVTAHIGG